MHTIYKNILPAQLLVSNLQAAQFVYRKAYGVFKKVAFVLRYAIVKLYSFQSTAKSW